MQELPTRPEIGGHQGVGPGWQGCHCGSGSVSGVPHPFLLPPAPDGERLPRAFSYIAGDVLELRTQDTALAPSPNTE